MQIRFTYLFELELILKPGIWMAKRRFSSLPIGEAQDTDGHTPLHLAAYRGHENIIRPIIDSGANVEARDKDDNTPLLCAAYNGREAIVRRLLLGGANIEAKDIDGWTPLFWAAYMDHSAIARLLVERGAKTEAKDEHGWTPLRWAVRYGRVALVKVLLDTGVVDVNSTDRSNKPLVSCAYEYGQYDIVRTLLRTRQIDLLANNNDSWLLHWAVAVNEKEMITLLLDGGVNLDTKDSEDRTAFWVAVYWDNLLG
ncbi:hypothetical protein MKX08_007490 [Trichoderma sp. CBMAI-0020]|nr:hypothetical protein MKX08_007490 [Trichoderma sp. CBMAI-0020]